MDLHFFTSFASHLSRGGDSKTAARLRAIIHPFLLRRTKSEVAQDLPAQIESDTIVDMAPDQRAAYTQVLRAVRAQVMGEVERVGAYRNDRATFLNSHLAQQ